MATSFRDMLTERLELLSLEQCEELAKELSATYGVPLDMVEEIAADLDGRETVEDWRRWVEAELTNPGNLKDV